MKTLEVCYELDFSKISFLERKVKIKSKKTFVYGAPKCGKTYLIYDYLANFDTNDYIYIDFKDFRNDLEEIRVHLSSFIIEKKIKILVLENFDFSFELPKCESIIISNHNKLTLENFEHLHVKALDFEEYLLHETRFHTATQAFNNFLKYGNMPGVVNLEEHTKERRLQEILRLYTKDETYEYILKILFLNIDEKKSLYQLFNTLKNQIKISKDKFYATVKTFENSGLVYFLPKYNQEKAIKKVYSYNHAFLNAISHAKKFKNEFTNMVFLQLESNFEKIYYLDNIDFFIPSENYVILSIPFFNPLLKKGIEKKLNKVLKENEIKKIDIVTVGYSENFFINDIEVEVLPFFEWAVS
ncbi:ATP-binding protein (AAA domain) [Malaciobacter marinus]|jgi:predicted AAA+ superfamily ATPase|uniref:ATP-binding protein (AAA domain) n=1 Tax=Malaciobacter marinus TaxID=505249 RepID=A0A1T5C8P1_9BACT|nr:ATP-binding protein [Malaciobacter marinus]AXX86603.1 ATP-binding protein (AAA domain) [Malaciobacter marinus]PHO16443.1 hypothetical protein CPH92_01875 [Malaciobacter marinus]SKB55818.1 hypothetical protein SAMN06295997_11962 [Malaciobacter marinus]